MIPPVADGVNVGGGMTPLTLLIGTGFLFLFLLLGRVGATEVGVAAGVSLCGTIAVTSGGGRRS